MGAWILVGLAVNASLLVGIFVKLEKISGSLNRSPRRRKASSR